MTQERAICLNCIDGRVQLPVIYWIKDINKVEHVDMITEPGMDGLIADNNNPIDDIVRKMKISIKNNNAVMVFIVGHHDCRANPRSDLLHNEQVLKAVDRIKKAITQMPVIGIWVNSEWKVVKL